MSPDHKPQRMTVVSIEGHRDISTFGEAGPKFMEVKVNLENADGDSWFILPHDAEYPRIGDVYVVPNPSAEPLKEN